jgi:hypothetical protein
MSGDLKLELLLTSPDNASQTDACLSWPHTLQRPVRGSTSLSASSPHRITNGASVTGALCVHVPKPQHIQNQQVHFDHTPFGRLGGQSSLNRKSRTRLLSDFEQQERRFRRSISLSMLGQTICSSRRHSLGRQPP